MNQPTWITIGSGMNPVTKMTCLSSCLWCVAGSQVKVYSSDSNGMLELLQTIQINGENRGVSTLTAGEDNIWVAHSSSVIKCYSSATYDVLVHLDVGPEVSKILSGTV